MIGDVLNNILTNDTTVGGLVGDRVLPFGAEQTTLKPYITYQIISKTPTKTKDRETELQTLRVQIDMFSTTYQQCATIADAVIEALSFYTGANSGETVDIITFEDERDMYSDQSEVYRKSQDYMIRLKY